jgi:hypothetical protein
MKLKKIQKASGLKYKFSFKYGALEIAIGRPKTCWYHKHSNPAKPHLRMRKDYIFGIHRIFMRPLREYYYELIIGRLRVGYWIYSKKNRELDAAYNKEFQ